MQVLTYALALSLLNTGNEITAQCTSGDLQELHLGVGEDAYMPKRDAVELFGGLEFSEPLFYAGLNPLYVHLTDYALWKLLEENSFVVSEDQE